MSTSKFKVRAGHTVTLGPEKEDGPLRVFKGGDSVELTPEEAAEMPWAIEKGEKPKTLRQRRQEAEAALKEIEKEEAKSRKHAKSSAGKKEREAALKSIEDRPDNAASGEPSYGRIPDADIAHLERLQEGEVDDADEAATEHGFGREKGGGGATAARDK